MHAITILLLVIMHIVVSIGDLSPAPGLTRKTKLIDDLCMSQWS